MARDDVQERFAYDFEVPIVEVEKQLRQLTQKAATHHTDLSAQIERLEHKRDELLKEIFENLTPFQRVRLARHPARPHPIDFVEKLVSGFIELHGDRRFGEDTAIVAGLGRVDEHRVVVIATRKGKETREKVAANFGMPQPEGYRKALHKMRLAEKFGLPVVCLIDTAGAACGVGAEERGQAMAIAENILAMAGLRVPIVVLVTGEACSGGALGVGVGDRFAMLENAYYSVITPEGCASILWKDGTKGEDAAEAMKLTATDLLAAGVIDQIIPEPTGGAHRDPAATMRNVDRYLCEALDELKQVPIEDLLEDRYLRYRRLGVYEVRPVAAPAGDQGGGEVEEA